MPDIDTNTATRDELVAEVERLRGVVTSVARSRRNGRPVDIDLTLTADILQDEPHYRCPMAAGSIRIGVARMAELEDQLEERRAMAEKVAGELAEVRRKLLESHHQARVAAGKHQLTTTALEDELVEFLEMDVESDSIDHGDGWGSIPPDGHNTSARNAMARLVQLNRWQPHPTEPGLYRHSARSGEGE